MKRELVVTGEPTVITKTLPTAIVGESGQSGGCLANPAGAMKMIGGIFSARPVIFSISSPHP